MIIASEFTGLFQNPNIPIKQTIQAATVMAQLKLDRELGPRKNEPL